MPRASYSPHTPEGGSEDDDEGLPLSAMASLQARIGAIRDVEEKRSRDVSRNFREGYWTVRGFMISDGEETITSDSIALDPQEGFDLMKQRMRMAVREDVEGLGFEADGAGGEAAVAEPPITAVKLSPSAEHVCFGRSDGSAFIVKNGEESFASFVGKNEMSMGKEGGVVSAYRFVREGGTSGDWNEALGGDENEDGPAPEDQSEFEIVAQFEGDAEAGVTCIEALDDGSDANEPVFVAGDSKGQLHVLVIEQVVTSLQVGGGGRIVAIKVIDDYILVATENKVLKYALLLEEDSVPVGEWGLEADGDENAVISCLSVADDLVFVGTSGGSVVVLQSEAGSDAIAFKHQVPALFKPVTAIHAVAGSTVDSSGDGGCCLVIGGGAGEVKQFEILRGGEGSQKISHWPMLPNQRMKRRAHVFNNPNDEPIVGLVADASKIIVADASGAIRFFSPRDGGSSLYMMDGLDGITCINLEGEVLVSNGMDTGFIALHDFGKIEGDLDGGRLDML